MQGPLRATPWLAAVYRTTVIIEDTMAIDNFHLDGIAVLAPISPGDFFTFHAKMFNHSILVVFIK
jgi:hypothetical protein